MLSWILEIKAVIVAHVCMNMDFSTSHYFYTACGEPPQCMSCSVLFAIKRAIESARAEIQQQQVFGLCKLHITASENMSTSYKSHNIFVFHMKLFFFPLCINYRVSRRN